jgi:hypothetical protein
MQDLPGLPGTAVSLPPRVASVSLGKHHGILQYNGLVITGWLPAWGKWLIEFVLLKVAAGSQAWLMLWMRMEWVTVVLASMMPLTNPAAKGR